MAICAFASALALIVSMISQQATAPGVRAISAEEPAIKLHARLVNLNIKVVDPSGRPLPQLKRDEFVVLEDNVPQEVTYFEPVAAPVNLLLLLDLSGVSEASCMR